jgi:hypothetical protein
MAHCIPSKDLQYQLLQGKQYRLYLEVATPLIVYGAESMFASKDDQNYYYRGVYLLFVSFSTVFMQDSHCLMTPQIAYSVHCKKEVAVFPSPAGMSLTQTLSGREKTKLFPPRKSLISDIPAGDGKTANSFLQCRVIS